MTDVCHRLLSLDFNPTLVRLAPLSMQRLGQLQPMFQSHPGSISTQAGLLMFPTSVPLFQSHPGSISTGGRPRDRSGGPGFNPTLVRLALLERTVGELQLPRFNPTLVRLAHEVPSAPLSRARSFNPTLVRLAHILRAVRAMEAAAVSIPPWFD